MSNTKIGRNEPCPCGSGLKYKRCHGGSEGHSGGGLPAHVVRQALKQMQAQQTQRQKQQGLGRPIISTVVNGTRIVAVGSGLLWSRSWLTFHDFLLDYIKRVFGSDWGIEELRKPLQERHPIIQWYDVVCSVQRETITEQGKVSSAQMNGAIAAYLGLAYRLYLLAHNVELHRRLVARLRNSDQFYGAYYETFVASAFIRAGFSIELEDEADGSSTHCEFVTVHPGTKKRYSVEAKARRVDQSATLDRRRAAESLEKMNIGNQLYKALKKDMANPRVVFIDVNVHDTHSESENVKWLASVLETIKRKELSLTIDGTPAPPAYVFVTNFPYHHDTTGQDFRVSILADGFKIPDFKLGSRFASLHEALVAREHHRPMFELMEHLIDQSVPSTFDGDIPDLAFGNLDVPRLLIGQRYVVPNESGEEVPATLVDACVLENERTIYGVYKPDTGGNIVVTNPMTELELSAYRRHPDTFFGVLKKTQMEARDAIDLFDFFFDCYRQTSKERLIELMSEAMESDELRAMSQSELATLYCERMAEAAFARSLAGS